MHKRTAGKVGVVTGASSAIGMKVAERLAVQHEMRIACVSRKPFAATLPPGCQAFQADVTNSKSCDDLFKSVAASMGKSTNGVCSVVNCAGVTLNKLLLRCTDEDFDFIMNTNVRGSINVCRSALRYGGLMKQSKEESGASVVLVGSVVGVTGNEGQVLYSASKAALGGAVKSLAKEYNSKNIRFNVVSPGLVEGKGMSETLTEVQLEAWRKNCPLGRLATPDDVADAIVSVLLSSYINGQVISVDGGMS